MAKKEEKEKQDVLQRMVRIEEKQKQGDYKNCEAKERLAAAARAQTSKVQEVHEAHKLVEFHGDLQGFFKGFKRIEKSGKLKQQKDNYFVT